MLPQQGQGQDSQDSQGHDLASSKRLAYSRPVCQVVQLGRQDERDGLDVREHARDLPDSNPQNGGEWGQHDQGQSIFAACPRL